MNKIDEIARRVWKDVCKSSSVGESLAVKYASALLAELSKDAKPIGWWNGKETAFFEHETDGPVGEVNIPLFTRPIPANTAEIEQRVVEAESLKWKEACRKEYLSAIDWAGKTQAAEIDLAAEQSKVKVLTDALENIERHAVNPWASWALEALATVKEK